MGTVGARVGRVPVPAWCHVRTRPTGAGVNALRLMRSRLGNAVGMRELLVTVHDTTLAQLEAEAR